MRILKKTPAAPAEPFRVLTLAEASSDYAALAEKRGDLLAERASLESEKLDLERKIAADTTPEMRPSVAELLGDPASGKAMMRKRLAEIIGRLRDLEAAIEIVGRRIGEARTKASLIVSEAAKPEYGRRVAAICRALEAVAAARAEYAELVDQFERNDISWLRLMPFQPSFLGDPRDGHLAQYIQEAKTAGYYDA